MKKIIYISLIIISVLSSCRNQDFEFPDYDYTTVYFPYQNPIRTLVLGEDIYDNSLDNEHKCKIMATMGGVYDNKVDRILNVVVDNSLCNNLIYSDDSTDVVPMPEAYYSLAADKKIVIPAGSITGGIEVKLNDAFFNDPLAVQRTYVIPLKIESVENADSVLRGKQAIVDADPRVADHWVDAPKDYVLYCVKYINPWHGSYLRRGTTVAKGNNGNNALDTSMVYRNQYVERDQVVKMTTISMDEVALNLKTRNKGNENDVDFELRIKVDNTGKCVLSQPNGAAYTVTGNGAYVVDGDMWGGEKKDVMHLSYNVDFGNTTHTFTDTLVIRDRGVKFELFTPVVKK